MKTGEMKIGYIYEDIGIGSVGYKKIFEVIKIKDKKITIKYLTGNYNVKIVERFTITQNDDDLSYIKEIGKVEDYPEYFI